MHLLFYFNKFREGIQGWFYENSIEHQVWSVRCSKVKDEKVNIKVTTQILKNNLRLDGKDSERSQHFKSFSVNISCFMGFQQGKLLE